MYVRYQYKSFYSIIRYTHEYKIKAYLNRFKLARNNFRRQLQLLPQLKIDIDITRIVQIDLMN